MKKQTGILLVIAVLIVAGVVFFYFRSLQTSYGTVIISASPPVNPVSTTGATPSPTQLSPEEQDKQPGGMFLRTATGNDFSIAGIDIPTAKPKDIITLFGQPQSKKKPNDPYATGVIWHYSDFDIEVPSTGDAEVYSITINRGVYKTARGIGIGDPTERIFEKYSVPNETGDKSSWYSYVADCYEVLFIMENGKVSKIQIRRYCG
jgi:hypothetical protein